MLVVLAVMVTVIVLTRLHIIKQQHIYEDVTPGECRVGVVGKRGQVYSQQVGG